MATDHTVHARNASRVNASLCSHRFKREDGLYAWCDDCNCQLFRVALKRRTGKTARVRGEEKKA